MLEGSPLPMDIQAETRATSPEWHNVAGCPCWGRVSMGSNEWAFDGLEARTPCGTFAIMRRMRGGGRGTHFLPSVGETHTIFCGQGCRLLQCTERIDSGAHQRQMRIMVFAAKDAKKEDLGAKSRKAKGNRTCEQRQTLGCKS